MLPPIPAGWRDVLGDSVAAHLAELDRTLELEARTHTILPAPADIFRALELTPYDRVRAVLLGQDPYPTPGHAHGLAFSVPPGVRPPPSLRNIFRELMDDLGCPTPASGSLVPWAERGVLLLNTVLTVRAGDAFSHKRLGWQHFTSAVIRRLADRPRPAVFLLWGAPAARAAALVDPARHPIVTAAHPSPLSAARGFFGSRPFSRANAALARVGQRPIDWCLPAGPPAAD